MALALHQMLSVSSKTDAESLVCASETIGSGAMGHSAQLQATLQQLQHDATVLRIVIVAFALARCGSDLQLDDICACLPPDDTTFEEQRHRRYWRGAKVRIRVLKVT